MTAKVGYEHTPEDLAVCAEAVELFGCDDARISKPMGTLFLIIGTKRRSEGEWRSWRGGRYEPVSFDYMDEKCIASGDSHSALRESRWRFINGC